MIRYLEIRSQKMYLVKMRSYGIGMGPNPMTGALIIKRAGHTDRNAGKTPCEDKSRDQCVTVSSERMPRIVGNHQKLGRSMEQILPQNFPDFGLQHLDFGFPVTKTMRINFCCFKLPHLQYFCYSSPRKQKYLVINISLH